MLKILEKPFGRTIGVAVVDASKNQVVLGFETSLPPTTYCRLPYGKFAIRVKSTDTFDLVVRLDNKVLVEQRLTPGLHTVNRANDGKPLMHMAPGSKPEFVADNAGSPVEVPPAPVAASAATVEEGAQLLADGSIVFPAAAVVPGPAAPPRLYPESDPAPGHFLAETQGLLIVQVRFAHIQPDYGPMLPPDDFTAIRYQLNEPKAHALALARNFRTVIRPEAPPDGTPDILDPENSTTPPLALPKRTCCIACDRDHHH